MSYTTDPKHTLRKMARTPSPFTSTWYSRLQALQADADMAHLLAKGHKDRIATVRKLVALDGRTAAAKAIVRELNEQTRLINEFTALLLIKP